MTGALLDGRPAPALATVALDAVPTAPLDPGCIAALASAPDAEADWTRDPPAHLRRVYAEARAALAADVAPGVAIRQVEPGLLFTPEAPIEHGLEGGLEGGLIIYFHGGGFIVGSPETHRVAVSHLAALSGLRVLSARYPLAPEHAFPAQAEAAAAVVEAAVADGIEGVAPPARMVLAGDSAGAAVAFWAEARLGTAAAPRISGVLALYGAFGQTSGPSVDLYGERSGSGLGRADLIALYARLGSATGEIQLWETAPLAGAPAYLLAAGCDPLRDDSLLLHRRFLSGDLRPATLDLAPSLPHAFAHFAARAPVAKAALARAADWARTRCAG